MFQMRTVLSSLPRNKSLAVGAEGDGVDMLLMPPQDDGVRLRVIENPDSDRVIPAFPEASPLPWG